MSTLPFASTPLTELTENVTSVMCTTCLVNPDMAQQRDLCTGFYSFSIRLKYNYETFLLVPLIAKC